MNAAVAFPTADELAALSPEELAYLEWQLRWAETARPNQLPPAEAWDECGFLAGRGFGKTRVGAEWLGRATYDDPEGFDAYVICPTLNDVKFTAFEGESGLMSVVPPELIVEYNKTNLFIRMKNLKGDVVMLRGFGAEEPERLRGPQAARCWADEVAAWARPDDTWDMMQFGLRLGSHPQVLWTTTPKPNIIIRRLTQPQAGRVIVRGTTFDNRKNLPKSFFKQLEQYEGTKLGRQELHGELIDPEEAGIIRRSWFRLWPAKKPLPQLDWVVMSLDTAFTEATTDRKTGDADYSACTVWGSFRFGKEQHIILLDCWQEQFGLPDLIKRTRREMQVAYGDDQDAALLKPMFGAPKPQTSGRKPDLLVIEDKGSGISLRQSLEREGLMAYAYNPGRADKLSRLHMVSTIFARRRVWLPESDRLPGKPRTWIEPLLEQLCAFSGPGTTKHDDFVDSTTQALRVMMDKGLVTIVRPPSGEQMAISGGRHPGDMPLINPYAA